MADYLGKPEQTKSFIVALSRHGYIKARHVGIINTTPENYHFKMTLTAAGEKMLHATFNTKTSLLLWKRKPYPESGG